MLWMSVRVGGTVYIDGTPLKLIDKDKHGIVVTFEGETYDVPRGDWLTFPTFTLHAGNNPDGLRLGFEAPQSVVIRREKLETQLPAE